MKIRIPLDYRTSGDELCPQPAVWLKVRDRYGTYAVLRFRVDTQADVCAVPIGLAEQEKIPFSRQRVGSARGIAGVVRKFRDRIRVVIAGKEHNWPCDFTEPAVDAETQQRLPDLLPVLGRAGFLGEYAIEVDNEFLVITRIGPVRRWVRRKVYDLWQLTGLVHPANKPL